MPSSAVDSLPDPLAGNPAGAFPNPDEMLAKMATEEIDRLLAEAEDGQSPASPTQVAPASLAPEAASGGSARVTVTTEAANDPELAKQLDDLFNALTAGDPAQTSPVVESPATEVAPVVLPSEETAPAAQPQEEPPSVASLPSPAEPSHEDLTSNLERQVLAAASLASIPEPAAPAAVAQAEVVEEPPGDRAGPAEPRLMFLLRPVARVSERFSEATLDWMGKVAILTTLNALAILAYIIVFRR